MIVIEGPNLALRSRVRQELIRQLGKGVTVHIGGQRPDHVNQLRRQLWADNRLEIRDGLLLQVPRDHGLRHMVAAALKATGTMYVVCCESHVDLHKMRDLYMPDSHYVSHAIITDQADLSVALAWVINVWQENVSAANQTFEFCSSGTNQAEPIMVVGQTDQNIEQQRRLAFTSHHAAHVFMHTAMLAAGAQYYLTNANKTPNAKTNRHLLHKELVRVCPSKVIAMGTEAGAVLADLRVQYEQTYHPQYWKRFKNKDFSELVQLLAPTKPNHHIYAHR